VKDHDVSISEACDKLGIAYHLYHYDRTKLNKRKALAKTSNLFGRGKTTRQYTPTASAETVAQPTTNFTQALSIQIFTKKSNGDEHRIEITGTQADVVSVAKDLLN